MGEKSRIGWQVEINICPNCEKIHKEDTKECKECREMVHLSTKNH